MGKEITKEIVQRTRQGKSVTKDGGPEVSLKPLSKDYVEQRRSLQKKGKLSNKTSPGTSNLTQTGKMLDGIKTEVIQNGDKTTLLITFNNSENEDKALYVSEDRPFMNLSDAQIARIEFELQQVASEEIAKELDKL